MFSLFLRALLQPSFSVVGGEQFMAQLLDSRICWVRGVLGGGKTSLAFSLAAWLLSDGGYKYIASNVPHKFPKPNFSFGVTDSVVVLDEGGVFLDSRNWQTNPRSFYMALRKLHTIVLVPSKNPPDKRLQELIVEPVARVGWVWFYRWSFELGSISRAGEFAISHPSKIFGLYSTDDFSSDDAGLLALFDFSIEQLKNRSSDWLAYNED